MRSLAAVLRVSSTMLEDRDQKSLMYLESVVFYLLLTCWKAHSFRTKRNALADLGFPLSADTRCCMFITSDWQQVCSLSNLCSTSNIKNWILNNRLVISCTVFTSLCWWQCFKTLLLFCSGFFFNVSVLCLSELYRFLNIFVMENVFFFAPTQSHNVCMVSFIRLLC